MDNTTAAQHEVSRSVASIRHGPPGGLSAFNGLGIINICNSDINKIQLKSTICQEHAVIAAERAGGDLMINQQSESNGGEVPDISSAKPGRNFFTALPAASCFVSRAPRLHRTTPTSCHLGPDPKSSYVYRKRPFLEAGMIRYR